MNIFLNMAFELMLVGTSSVTEMVPIPQGFYTPVYSAKKKENKIAKSPKISVKPFMMDKTAVTRAQFLEFLRTNPKWRRSQIKSIFSDKSYLKDWKSDLDPGKGQSLNSPVRYVSWFAARAYCLSQDKRLPSTAEWERAGAAFKKFEDVRAKILEWYSKPNFDLWPEVGSGPQNDFGVFDLHGVIWEWVEDFNSNLVSGESRSDSSPDSADFCGAGGLNASDVKDYAAFMRYGFRNSLKGSYTTANLGFRCAKDLPKKGSKK